MSLAGVKAIVTGGASGLGAATVAHLAAKGASVTVLDREAAQGAATAAAHGATFAEADVTDEASVQAAIDHAVAAMGGINAAVNCAGIAIAERVVGRKGAHRLESFRRTVDINLVGTFNVTRLAALAMSDNAPDEGGQRGVIVNTASIAAFDGQKGQAAYAASKAGIAGLSLPLARDLASHGIRVCAIAPGIFRTPMLEGLGQDVMDGLAADVTFPPSRGAGGVRAPCGLHPHRALSERRDDPARRCPANALTASRPPYPSAPIPR